MVWKKNSEGVSPVKKELATKPFALGITEFLKRGVNVSLAISVYKNPWPLAGLMLHSTYREKWGRDLASKPLGILLPLIACCPTHAII